MLDYSKSFIEVQFPVSKISKESYKERMANLGQTLTGLGKWWGRKPLVLVRATIIGALLPVSNDLEKDRDIFLKIMLMDDEGLYLRKHKNLTQKQLYNLSDSNIRDQYMEINEKGNPVYKRGVSKKNKDNVQKHVFNKLSYDERLKYSNRPEHIENLSQKIWDEVNSHLNINVNSFESLIFELGMKRFGHRVRIGDVFSGGGSIPFESARLGAETFALDLNPVAAMLTWAAVNIGGATENQVDDIKIFQERVYKEVDSQVTNWGIEHNEMGHRADSYLYCMEANCPECNHNVPLAPSWIVGKGTKTVAILNNNGIDGFDIDIVQNATKNDINNANRLVTIKGSNMYCPNCEMETPITSLRGDRKDLKGQTKNGLRLWEQNEFKPRDNDVYRERLYCIRYVSPEGRYYTAPTIDDIKREEKVVHLLNERYEDWQNKGYIPSDFIIDGLETTRLKRERGWQYWHHLYNPRQLLLNGLFAQKTKEFAVTKLDKVIGMLGINKLANFNSKLSMWVNGAGVEKVVHVFTNQSLNPYFDYGSRSVIDVDTLWYIDLKASFNLYNSKTELEDARNVNQFSDIWITDPPYADAVNYHELSEFFLAWDKELLKYTFPEWYTDSKRVLAVKGTGKNFNDSMIEIYSNLTTHMPDNGIQIVMFTHQDVNVWAELAMILWSSGLRVVSAWTISTETVSGGLKSGNYVSGTVLLILKKQMSNEKIYQDELYDEINYEVRTTIDLMRDINDKDDPDFNDADFILASYAAALKAITSFKEIAGIDIPYWLEKGRDTIEKNPIVELVQKAQSIAYDYLIPEGFDKFLWRDLTKEERFFIRGLELEMDNIYKVGDYQELARGFGVTDYSDMLYSTKANKARFKTAIEFKRSFINNGGFGNSLTRHLLVALQDVTKEKNVSAGLIYLKTTYQQDNEYWKKKNLMLGILNFISRAENIEHMAHWKETAYSARILREALRNDGV